MPTTHVGPESQEALQDIANGLLKARKVVVVTGAGISTNSGIPDFRSENGLYSLIQAQFDAAAQQARQAGAQSDNESSDADNGRASKRRKLSVDDAPSTEEETSIIKDEIEVQGEESDPDSEVIADTIQVEGDPDDQEEANAGRLPLVNARTTRSTIVAQPMTSPLSSPPPEDLNIPLSAFRRSRHNHLADVGVPPSSSPLSSPPPVLFDPFSSNMPSEGSPSRRCSTSPSEVDDTPPSNPISLSQPNLGPSRNTLPNMKGKDLFDASIWADPIRTSVFYTFATTLRQKVKDVEPTSSHRFISHLRDRGKLVRCYTQNIDQIEEKVGLSTCLNDGPGSRGRFSRKSTANMNQLSKMVDEVAGSAESSSSEKPQASSDTEATRSKSQSQSDGTTTPPQGEPDQSQPQPEASKAPAKNIRRELPKSGVECVFLHGSLELLRCFLCGRVCSWDDEARELETMSGQQPECPHCVGATTAREERGKRALGVGKLRPDIVLYGEEHPNAHLISPIVTHDLALCPDLLLILGTSLRVHGLKVMVREFAKAVHAKGGKVVFVNFTKPPESSWGDIIDYWIEWDCDAWVADLHAKVPKLWQAPEPPKPKKKRESSGLTEDGEKTETKRPPAAYPVALRDTKATGAYCTLKILKELHRISGHQPPARRASMSAAVVETTTVTTTVATTENKTEKAAEKTADAQVPTPSETSSSSSPSKPKPRTRARRPRKSAPANLGRAKATPSTLNPNHGRTRRNAEPVEPPQPAAPAPAPAPVPAAFELTNPIITPERLSLVKSSILESVKSKPRVRKRKKIDGEEVVMPTVGKRRATQKSPEVVEAELGPIQLPPLKPQPPSPISSPFGRPVPIEPSLFAQGYNTQNKCSETGQLQSISPVSTQKEPLTSMSINMRRPMPFTRSQAFAMGNSSTHQNPSTPPQVEKPRDLWFATPEDVSIVVKRDSTLEEREAILALTRLSQGHPRDPPATTSVMVPETRGVQTRSSARLMELCSAAGSAEGELRSWGGRWNTNR
ncbi:hypothetical protein CEP53_014053 [Fusarium sp. AF-6]|nr:hypothetical protein CEP53_014053 [Fusarium sp. AF-6]